MKSILIFSSLQIWALKNTPPPVQTANEQGGRGGGERIQEIEKSLKSIIPS